MIHLEDLFHFYFTMYIFSFHFRVKPSGPEEGICHSENLTIFVNQYRHRGQINKGI